MGSLRWYIEIHIGCVTTFRYASLFLVDFDGEVRAAQFTEPTADAQIGFLGKDLAIPECQDLLWAEGYADVAALAPAFPDDVLEGFFLFTHNPTLVLLSALRLFIDRWGASITFYGDLFNEMRILV
jgi:hypothetical protein